VSAILRKLATAILRPEVTLSVLTLGAAAGGYIGMTMRGGRTVEIEPVRTTVGDLQSLHAEVLVSGREVRGSARLFDGADVKTGSGGRARMRLDDGTVVIVDGGAELALHGQRITLSHGRLFVQAGASSRTEVAVRDSIATVVSSAAAFDASEGHDAKVYCARGELVIAVGGKSVHVASGETGTLPGGAGGAAAVKVAPETAFDDWTGGLAVPWTGERAPASAIAELWAGSGDADPGSPLVVRSEKVDVTIEGELAITRTRTTYFNGSDANVQADVRMALPDGAVVSRVARQDEGSSSESSASIGVGNRASSSSSASRLEWAGGSWLRGTLGNIRGGSSVDLLVDYVEWLPERDGRATYRFPMASDVASPMVGGLSVRVSSQASARWLSASTGAGVVNGAIELHRADVRPTGDLVVEMIPSLVHAGAARAYVEQGGWNEDPYLLVRTEAPELGAAGAGVGTGVTLALVVDTSSSMGPALLETERAAVDALLESLGPKDSVVVLAADQSTQIVGPDRPSPVTPELRAHVAKDLGAVHAGGASNLGLALERAADLLDLDKSASGMVVYLGDGRPTVGETDARELRKRLAARARGVPRLGALAIGQGADHWMLAELVAGAGPVYDVIDRPDAARASSALVADALTPTLRDVSIAFGPGVDRVYPRDARTAIAGTTLTFTGRLRGELPKQIALRYRQGTQLVEEVRPLELVRAPAFADTARRWAKERIEENVARAEGIEPAIALAVKSKLLTPWTGWFFDGSSASVPWPDRLLGLSAASDTAYASKVQPAPPPPSLLLEPPAVFEGEASIEQAAEIAARHSIREALASMVACRDARASIKPGVGGFLRVSISVNADGHASKVAVHAWQDSDDDAVLDRCIRVVVDAIPFFAAGVGISFTQDLSLPALRTSQRTECSVASTLPLAVRRGIWRARKAKGNLDYFSAAHACELPTWGDRRTLLTTLVTGMNAQEAMALSARLSEDGDTDSAAFVRQELLRQTNISSSSYEELRRLLIDDEPKIDRVLDRAYSAARNDDARLAVLRRFLRLAPHSPLGRRLLLSLLEAKNDRGALFDTIEQIRNDVFADAGLVAECASILRRLGMDQEGRRAFGELVERAPRDPWTLGYVGDRLRAEGLYEDALAAYARLDAAMPDDPAVALRLALAHAGAGRLDVATRLLDRVAQTGGRGDDGRLGELASVVAASLIATARQGAPAAETDALLVRRLAQTPLPDVASVILVRTPLTDDKVEVSVARTAGAATPRDRDELPADLDASAMGLSAVRIERGGGTARIRLRRSGRGSLVGARPTRGLVTALVLGSDRAQARLVTREVDIVAGDKGTELRWNGEAFE
jgi:Ca-activated chloride channel family protein